MLYFWWKHIYLSVVIFVFAMCEIQNWAFFPQITKKQPKFHTLAGIVCGKELHKKLIDVYGMCVCLLGISKLIFLYYLIYKTTHKYGPMAHFTSFSSSHCYNSLSLFKSYYNTFHEYHHASSRKYLKHYNSILKSTKSALQLY